jgi:putative ABC transport system substrate-binding protein
MPVIGFLASGSPVPQARFVAAFQQGLAETGYIAGKNVAIEYRWAEGHYDRLPALAADLVRRQVAVIVASGGPSAPAAKAATTTIPIVFQIGVDPVAVGLVASLNRPGGNLTGATVLGIELGPRRLELLHQLVPTAAIVGALVNPTRSNAETEAKDLQMAAGKLGLQLHILHAGTERDFDAAFATVTKLQMGGLVIGGDPLFNNQAEELAAFTIRHAVPAIFQFREFAAAGGLISYGTSGTDSYHQVGLYAGRILKGQRPADLPVQQSTKVELVINLRTAKALGLTVPQSLLFAADEVMVTGAAWSRAGSLSLQRSPDRRLAALVFQCQLRHGLTGRVTHSQDFALSGVEHRLAAEPRALDLRSVDASLAASADQFALELGNAGHDGDHEAPDAAGGVAPSFAE